MSDRWKALFTVSPIKISLFVILLSLTLFFMDVRFLRFMELKALDLRMLSRGAVPSCGKVVIAVIDEKSLSELGRWPWPRTTIARLVDALRGYGAKAIGFDIVFAESENNAGLKDLERIKRELDQAGVNALKLNEIFSGKKNPDDPDAQLAASIRRAQNVTLGYFFHTSSKDVSHLSEREIAAKAENISSSRYSMVKSQGMPDEAAFVHAYGVASNLPELSEAAENSGYFNAFPDIDGSIRWSPLLIKFQDNYYSSLALSLLLQYLDWPMLSVNMAEFGVESIRIDDLRIPTDESGRLLINYLGPAKTFPHYSIGDIISGRLAPELFKDKIVIVGATATGIYDLRVTPFGAVYPGVEIHATVIDNILRRNFLVQSGWTSFLDACFIILLGLLMGTVIPRLKALQGVLVGLIILETFIGANVVIFTRYKIWFNLVYPVMTILLVYLGITVYRYVTEEREKKKVRGAFQRYLNESVVNEILKDPAKLKLGGDKKNLTVLFSDIRGFTTISEVLPPEALVRLLNEYLTAMTEIVFKYDGLLDKYIGDAVMAVFGAPLEQPDHALRACNTALDMMNRLKELQKKWEADGWPMVDIGIGVNSGDMVAGNMGSEMRFDYTVMGDSVNLGSRLEGINKEYGTNIVISQFTHEAVRDLLCCRELDSVRVKGKKQPIKIYELLGRREDENTWEELIRRFHMALEHYKAARWDEAVAAFQNVLAIRPDDFPSLLYIQRCETLRVCPPEAVWDGVFTMTSK